MKQDKQTRIKQSKATEVEKRRKAVKSLDFCFSRSEVMRVHHDALVAELMSSGGIEAFKNSTTKKARFNTYVAYWFAGLSAAIERYQEQSAKGVIPISSELDQLMTPEFIKIVKQFRNAAAHCSEHDDKRVLELLSYPDAIPSRAEEIANAFRNYIRTLDQSTIPTGHDSVE